MTSAFSWQNSISLCPSKAKFACYSRCFLTSYFCIPVPYNEKDIFFGCLLVLEGLQVFIELFNFSFFSITVQGIGLDYCLLNGLPWKRTEVIVSFLRLYQSIAFWTLLLTMMATPFLLSDSCPLLLLLSCLSHPTLCNPVDGSPPGSSLPGILQARTLEWVAISFSNACMHAKSLQSCPTLCNLWTAAHQAPPATSIVEWVSISFSNLVNIY